MFRVRHESVPVYPEFGLVRGHWVGDLFQVYGMNGQGLRYRASRPRDKRN